MVSLRLSYFLHDYVWKYGISDMACGKRSGIFERSLEAILDNTCALGLGIFCNGNSKLGGTVQLRILQPYADLYPHRTYSYGTVQAENLVQLLPYGNYDSRNMSTEKPLIKGIKNWDRNS